MGAPIPTASGHGVINRPVSTWLRWSALSKKNGSETNANIWAAKDATDVATERLKTGSLKRSKGTTGSAWERE